MRPLRGLIRDRPDTRGERLDLALARDDEPVGACSVRWARAAPTPVPAGHGPGLSAVLDIDGTKACYRGQARAEYLTMSPLLDSAPTAVRLGIAAEMLGVSVETLRRWEVEGRIAVERTVGGRRRVPLAEVARLLAERRRTARERPIAAQSARNRFPGIVTRVEADRVAAVVEVQAGPHRLVSLMTAEAAQELDLQVGDEVVCSVKATNVVVEVPAGRERRRGGG